MIGLKVKNQLLDTNAAIYQDSDWFKFSLDSALLAQFVTINLRTKKIIDLATGNAPIPILLSFRTKASIIGVEYQKCVYELGVESVRDNLLEKQITLIQDDVKNLSNRFESDTFDVVTCNPPYFKITPDHYYNDNVVKSLARHEITLTLEQLLRCVNYLLKNGGVFAMVHRTERFLEIMETMKKYHLEPKRIQFIYPKRTKDSNLFLIEAIKNGNEGLKLLSPLIIHNDDDSYTDQVLEMLNFNR